MRVRFSRPALADLEAILAYIEADNPPAARRFGERLDGVIKRIAQFPRAAAEIAERPEVRRVPLVRYPYVIYYKVILGEAYILRIVHGARSDPSEKL
jgi:toxin ParE1/3/4